MGITSPTRIAWGSAQLTTEDGEVSTDSVEESHTTMNPRTLDKVVAFVGLAIVVVEIFVLGLPAIHMLIITVSALLMFLGTWHLSSRLLHKRANTKLRGEINRHIELVRQLYRARSSADSAGIHETKPELRDSLERIIQAASAIKEEET